MSSQVLIHVDDRSQVGEARRAAAEITRTLSFDETGAGNVAIAVTEAATNIVKHAGRGKLILRALESDGVAGVEVLALDHGPGIANLGASLRDGQSTAGSMGTGLGAIDRASATMEVFSQAGKGTALRLEFWARPLPSQPASFEVGAICLPKRGEVVSGDAWSIEAHQAPAVAGSSTSVRGAGRAYKLLVADGLGHGADAARAARTAVEALGKHLKEEPGEILRLSHLALASTRGAAVAVACFAFDSPAGVFAGVGNIAARVETPDARRQLVSHNGTVGHALRKVQEFPFEFPANGILILHSDGLAGHWTLAEDPGLMAKHASLIAGVLYRDHDRGRDDVTVVVIKRGSGS